MMNIRFFSPFSKIFFWGGIFSVAFLSETRADSKECSLKFKDFLPPHSSKQKIINKIDKQRCPVAHRLAEWIRLQKDGSFEEIYRFVTQFPTWPRQGALRRQAEKDLYASLEKGKKPGSVEGIMKWFQEYPPLIREGLMARARLLSQGNHPEDRQKFHHDFLEIKISGPECRTVIQKYPSVFSESIIFEKALAYLDREESSSARALLSFLTPKHQKTIEKRVSLQQQTEAKNLHFIHSAGDNEPELSLEWVRTYRKMKDNEKARELLQLLASQQEADNLYVTDEVLWVERNILARRYLEEKSYQKAYDVLKDHGLMSGENFAHAEFMLGWVSLRFLKEYDQALYHFQNLYEKVKTPISVARAAYWIGKAYKALNDPVQAKEWFARAQIHQATYYGQLAWKEVSGKISAVKLNQKMKVSAEARRKFQAHPFVKAIQLLAPLKKRTMAESFALALAEEMHTEEEQYLMVDFLKQVMEDGTVVEAYKKSVKLQAPLFGLAYPKLPYVPSHVVHPAFAHAIIRQESRFKSDGVSTAGALGLMQLMPATADRVLKAQKIKKRPLTDPHHNVTLGCHHLKELLTYYRGSHVLAAAAYNAGTKPVDEWIEQFGDPRHAHVDSVDWIENIPYFETRNYVQRVMENYHCYIHHN